MAILTRLFSNQKQKISLQEQTLLLERIGQLLNQGYSILEALSRLKWYKKWDDVLDSIAYQLESGQKFDQILADLQFDQRIVSFIYFALQHGNLVEAINHSVMFINQQINLFNRFKQAIRYPILLAGSFLIILFFVDLYVYPAFLQIYSTNATSSQILTLSISIVKFIFNLLYFMITILLITLVAWKLVKKKLTIKQKAQLLNFSGPAGLYVKKYNSLMFAIHLSSLLEAGLSLKSSLTLIVNHNKQLLLSYYCHFLLDDLENGISFEQALKKHAYFEENLILLFKNKVNRQILKRDLNTYTTFALEQLQRSITKLINRIQPTVFTFIALSIVLIYLSILLPMLQMLQTI